MFPYIIQGTNITVVIDNVPHTISSTHMCYETVRTSIKNNDWDTVKQQICIPKFIADYSEGNVSIAGDKAYWKQRRAIRLDYMRMIAALHADSFHNLHNFQIKDNPGLSPACFITFVTMPAIASATSLLPSSG